MTNLVIFPYEGRRGLSQNQTRLGQWGRSDGHLDLDKLRLPTLRTSTFLSLSATEITTPAVEKGRLHWNIDDRYGNFALSIY